MLPIPLGREGDAIVERYFSIEPWERELENCRTSQQRAIKDFTGLDFEKINTLLYCEYLMYRRESWIFGLKQSESGRDFLKTLWRLRQTEADEVAIKEFNDRR